MKKLLLNPMFRLILQQVLMTLANSSALDPQERERIASRLADLDAHSDVIDSDGDGVPDHLDTDTPPVGGVVQNAEQEPTPEELLAAWRAANGRA
jgi:hypothetical protein